MKLTYKAIIGLLGAIVLVMQNLGVNLEPVIIDDIITGIAGVLVALGVVMPPKKEDNE